MDRCGIFIDVGYLYAAAGDLCCGTRSRKDLELDASGVISLVEHRAAACGLPVLRTYWYDGAKSGIPSVKQQSIAALPNVKLRLGRLNTRNQQKGVDALIYRDLMTLSSERSIADAYLMSGDEDLREAVKAAQDRGVRVTLIGVETLQGYNQSRELVEEVDELITLTRTDLASLIAKRASPVVPPAPGVPAPAPLTPEDRGEAFAKEWLTNATTADLIGLQAAYPRIPRTLDVELITFTEQGLGSSLRDDDAGHRAMRKGFWREIRKAKPSPGGS